MEGLQRWLNDEVGLSKHISNFEKDFANGYFFGEIFNKYNLQPDFRSFLNFNSTDSKMNNFARLEPSLRLLDIKFPSKTANEIMEEKKGVAARLLLTMKATLGVISEDDKRRANTPTSFPPLSRGSTQQQDQAQQPLSATQSQASSLSSSQTISSPPSQRNGIESPGKQGSPKRPFRTFDTADSSRPVSPQRLKSAHKEQPPSLQDVKPISLKIDKQKVDIKYQLYIEEKARKKKQKQTAEATNDVVSGIENFEKSLKNYTFDDPQQKTNPNNTLNNTLNNTSNVNGNRTRGNTSLSSSLRADDNENSDDSQKYMQQIKKKKDEEQIARQERDKRRRKILLEQQQAQKLLDDKQNEEMLLEKLLRQSKEERRLAARIVETRNKSKEIRKNRILREEQYAAQRQKEFELLLERDAQLGRAAKLEYELKAKLDRELFEQYEARRKVAKHDKHYAICGRIVGYFIVKELREWKTLFKAGVPLYPPKRSKSSAVLENFSYQSYEPEDEADSILDERDFLDYLKGKEDWVLSIPEPTPTPAPLPSQPPPPTQQLTISLPPSTLSARTSTSQQGTRPLSPAPSPSRSPSRPITPNVPTIQFDPQILVGVPQNNTFLGQIVSKLFSLALPQDPPPPPPSMPSFPMRAAILGKHLAGKSTILQKLAEKYRVAVISVDALVSNIIEQTKNEDINEFSDIGLQCLEARQEGREIDDQILVKLVVREINEIAARNEAENKSFSGWVLEGFPATVAQAQLLEKALTGYEAPLSPKGKKASRAKKKEPSSKKRGSQIAPTPSLEPLATSVTNPQSGIDLVIHVDVADDTVIRRAVGRRLDPMTGISYHLEYTPPPEHKGVHGRLVPVEEGESAALYQKISSFKDELAKLEKWFSRFNNFKVIDGDVPTGQIVEWLVELIEQIPASTAESEKEQQHHHHQQQAQQEDANHKETKPLSVEHTALVPVTPVAAAKPTPKTPNGIVHASPTFLTHSDIEMPSHKRVVGTIDLELATILLDRFLEMEAFYTTTAKSIFCRIRKERRTTLHHLALLRDDFLVYLKRPHTMQEHVQAFQQNFNEVDNDMRSDAETKQELHQRTDDLRDKLWDISDVRKSEAEAERKATNEDGWLEARVAILTNTFVSLMQLEVDRFCECRRLLKDFMSGHRKLPLDNTQVAHIELPLAGASPSLPAPALTSSPALPPPSSLSTSTSTSTPIPSAAEDPSAKPPARHHTLGGLASVGVAVQMKKKKTDGAPTAMPASVSASNPAIVPSTPKGNKQALSSSQNKAKANKKKQAEPSANRFDNEPFPDLYIAYSMAQNLVLNSEKKDETLLAIEGADVQQASQLEDKIFLSRLERIKDCALRVLKDTRGQSDKLVLKEEEWLGVRFLTEMNAISNLTRVVKETVEREKKLPYFFKLIGDDFIIEEDMLVFEPELAPPPPIPQERTYANRFSSDQISALTQRLALLAPWGLVAVKDCAELLYSLSATSEFGFEFLPTEWQDFDVAQFTKLAKFFIRVEAGTPGYMPNSTPTATSNNTNEFLDWREFLVFCIFLGSNSSHASIPSHPPPSLSISVSSQDIPDSAAPTPSASILPPLPSLPPPSASSATTPVSAQRAAHSLPNGSIPASSAPPTPSSAKNVNNTNTEDAIVGDALADAPSTTDVPPESADRQSEIGSTLPNRVSFFGNFAAPLPPSMAQLAEMKAAFKGVDSDNDGKV